MVDAADVDKLEASRNELQQLLDKPQLEVISADWKSIEIDVIDFLQGIPVLVLGNKKDLPNALDEKQLIEKLLVIKCWFCSLISFRKNF